jgi:hypothetical protein
VNFNYEEPVATIAGSSVPIAVPSSLSERAAIAASVLKQASDILHGDILGEDIAESDDVGEVLPGLGLSIDEIGGWASALRTDLSALYKRIGRL